MRRIHTVFLSEAAFYLSRGLELESVTNSVLFPGEPNAIPYCSMTFYGFQAKEVHRQWNSVPHPPVTDEALKALAIALGEWGKQ